MTDLGQRVPAHSLVDKLILEFEARRIRVDEQTGRVVIDDDSVSWYQGVLGERRVAEQLGALGDEFTVIHSVPFRKREGDIDHIVIGPAGVTIINTKHSPGRRIWSAGYGIYVGNRKEKGFITNLAEAVREAERRLSEVMGMAVPVRGVLCFVDPGYINRKAPAGGGEFDVSIEVVSDRELAPALTRRRELSEEQLQRLTAAAVLPGTWHDAPKPSTIGTHIAKEFDALELEIGADVQRRLAERAAEYEAERIAKKVARSQARASNAKRPVVTSAARGPRHQPAAYKPTLPKAQRKPVPTPRSLGAVWLGLWPLVFSALFTISSVTGMRVSLGTVGEDVFNVLSIFWLILIASPPALALADRLHLRRHAVLTDRVLLPWILLGPLAYLIARAVEMRRAGRAVGSTLVLHVVSAVAGGVLAFVFSVGAAIILMSQAG